MITTDYDGQNASITCDECSREVLRKRLTVIRDTQMADGRCYILPRGWAYRDVQVETTPYRGFHPVVHPSRVTESRIVCPACRRKRPVDAIPGSLVITYRAGVER